MILLWRAARDVRARGAELSAAGLFAPPAEGALSDIAGPGGIAVAALAFTVSLGSGGCLAAQFSADFVARGRRRIGRIGALVVVLGAGVIGLFTGSPLLALWLAALYALPLIILLPAASAGPPDQRRTGAIWAGVLILSLAVVSTVESADLRRFRDGILSLNGGEAFVNTYYRHAMLAAEPIKAPAQRHYLTWAPSSVLPPLWFRCVREPWLLLPIDTPNRADIDLRDLNIIGIAPANRRQRGSEADRLGEHDIGNQIEAAMRDADPAGLRAIVAVGLLVGGSGSVAWGLACLVSLGNGRWRTVAICAAIGLAVMLVPGDDSAGIEARIDGTGAERMRAVAAGDAGPMELMRMATTDNLLPVRARALAAWVRQAPDLEAAASQVAAATTWYEQWYGYHALVGRGWHPDADRCR